MTENNIHNNEYVLSQSQSLGLDILINNDYVFLSGKAGSGKSYLLNYYTKYYCQDKKVVKVAYSGLAATNLIKDKLEDRVGTIHSVFKLPTTGIIKPSAKPEYEDIKYIFSKYDVIVIDEISMVRIDIFEYLIKLIAKANKYRSSHAKIIFVGDFYQLPPIVTDNDRKNLYKYWNTYDGYCFESLYWQQLPIKHILLDQNIRSSNDVEYDTYLNNIKLGIDLNKTLDYFNKQVNNNLKPGNGIVELYSTNKLVDKVNRLCLKALPGKAISIKAYSDDEVLRDLKKGNLNTKNIPCALTFRLKPNAQVMFIVNDKIVDNVQRYVNGDLATVISCDQDEVVVRLLKNNKLVHLHKYNLNIPLFKNNGDRYLGQFKQYPLKLAYAMTIHKAQGKTFDKLNLDPKSDHELDPGQIYVALSRVRSIKDLNLYSPLELKHITFNKKVIEFYRSLDIEYIKDKLFNRED